MWKEQDVAGAPDIQRKLNTPLATVLNSAATNNDYTKGLVFVETAAYSGVMTIGQLVLLGTEPAKQLCGDHGRGKKGFPAFRGAMASFWPAMQLPKLPSPHVAAMLYDHPRHIRTFPWIVDYVGGSPIGQGWTGGRAPVREIYWSLELLMGVSERLLGDTFELKRGRTRDILNYYNTYGALFHTARRTRL